MLGERFQQIVNRRNQANAQTNADRSQRDAFIQAQFPVLDTVFAGLVDAAVGTGPLLSVTHTPATDTVHNRTFTSLNKTVTEVNSTLYGPTETVRFTPGLSFTYPEQFGVISLTKEGGPDPSADPRFSDVFRTGLLMSGTQTAALLAPQAGNFSPVTAAYLENLLAQLLIRT
jgi:hypothetical protein